MKRRPVAPLKRILVIRLSSLGDVILAGPLVRVLNRSHLAVEVDFLTRAAYRPMLDAFPELQERWSWEGNRSAQRRLAAALKARRYEVVVDLQNNLRSRLITARLSPPRVYRYSRPRFNRWLRINIPALRRRLPVPPPVPLGYLAAAAGLEVADDGLGLELKPPPQWLADAGGVVEEYLRRTGLPTDSPILTVAPGARHATKRWLPERWAEFLRAAYDAGWRSQVIVGDAGDESLTAEICRGLPHPVLNLAGKTDLPQLTGVIASAALFIGSDSGPMHIAAAVGTPLVAIFGPTVPEFGFAPFRRRDSLVQVADLACRPCHPHGPKRCPLKHFRCMTDITTSHLLAALRQVAPQPAAIKTAEVR